MNKTSQKEITRYQKNIDKMERALEIIRSQKTRRQKDQELSRIKMCRMTYGCKDYKRLEWAISRELRSFKHAIKNRQL